jgi:hypothetical protein
MTTIEQLPGLIPTTTRDREIERFKRSVRVRVPDADTGDSSPVDTDARVCADITMPLYAAAQINNNNTVLENSRGAALDQWADRYGIAPRREAFGASGAVTFAGSTGGSTILAEDELRDEATGLRYRVITTGTYVPGDPINVTGKDTGPATNVPTGRQLKWSSPRPGCSDYAVVAPGGLTGGADRENDDNFLLRIKQEMQNRAASGNDAEYQLEIESTPGVGVQKAFTWPAISHAGTTAYSCTVQPAHSGGSRCANSAQMALVEAHLAGKFPGDDGAMAALLADQNADVVLKIDWSENALGWADLAPWPQYFAESPSGSAGAIQVSAASSPTVFTLATANGVYTGARQPVVGQTLAFYDQAGFAWRRKRILSFTGTGPWVITCDTTNNASDVSYTPQIGQRACPWSDSLAAVLTGLWSYFDTLGPGEQVASFYDEGTRQQRQPRPTVGWSHRIATRPLIDSITAREVADVDLTEGDGTTAAVGAPGILAYLLLLRWVSVFPKS